jgi:Ca-activated chloride channel family protein
MKDFACLLFLTISLALYGGCSDGGEKTTNFNSASSASSSTKTATPVAASDQYCETVYQELLARHPVNFNECLPDLKEAPPCAKPDEAADDFKENLNVLVILDSSGSMAEKVAGGQKLQVAKEAIARFVETLPERTRIGLLVYGHKGSNKEAGKAASCAGIEMFYPFAALDKARFAAAVNSFKPNGYTPIAASLEKAGDAMRAFDGASNSNLIYLVSDGLETCGGDPAAQARRLHESNLKVIVNIIGFNVDNAGQQQLKAAAEAGGGQYFDARTADELNQIFQNREKQIKAVVAYRDCLSSKGYQDWLQKYGATTDYLHCMRDKRNQVYLGIRSDRAEFLDRDDPRKVCNPYIDRRNKEWSDAIDRTIEATVQRMEEENQANYEQIKKQMEAVEAEHQRLIKKQ